jgi:probable lipoprotein NlpC
MKQYLIFLVLLGLTSSGLLAAPLEGGYALAPKASASAEEKAAAVQEARFKVLSAAGKYEKTPYRYGGVDRNGLDCSGLVYLSFRDALAVSVPRTTTSLYAWAEKISTDKAQPGDLFFFKTDNTGKISHVGIFVGGNRFIHSASEGPVTGVMYSGLDEKYWGRTFAGAGRALPEGDLNARQTQAVAAASGQTQPATGQPASSAQPAQPAVSEIKGAKSGAGEEKKGHLMLGLAAAPSWNGFLSDGNIIRGYAGQIRLGAETKVFIPMIFGLELRPEWDGALGVFRLPITLSWGLNDKFRIFAGPVFSFGDAVIKTADGDRSYSGGTSWIGAAGITAAPFAFKIAKGELAPYAELAWQSYFSDNEEKNLNADFAAGLRLSTGLRFTWKF